MYPGKDCSGVPIEGSVGKEGMRPVCSLSDSNPKTGKGQVTAPGLSCELLDTSKSYPFALWADLFPQPCVSGRAVLTRRS